jgi:vacuolar-type H+-ATPase subunit E/Vma4
MADYIDVFKAKKQLDFAAKNYDNPNDYVARDKANIWAKDHGLTEKDIDMYRNAAWMPPTMANPIKNNVLDKVALKLASDFGAIDPEKSPIGFGERFAVKNLIDEDPDLQVRYLEKKGYKARIDNEGNLIAARPGGFFEKVDPSSFDPGDVIDLTGDAINAAMTGAATAAAALYTGPAAIAAIPAAGAASGALFESGKQAIAQLSGLREDYNYPRIVEKSLINAAMPLLPTMLGGVYKPTPKANIAEIKAAGKQMGATPTAGQLTTSRDLQMIENARWNEPSTIFNVGLKNKVGKNIEATDQYAANLLENRLPITTGDAGAIARESISSGLKEKLSKAENLYDSVTKVLDKPGYTVNTKPLQAKIIELKASKTYVNGATSNPQTTTYLDSKLEELQNVKTIGDLRKFNSEIRTDGIRFRESNPSASGAAKTILSDGKTLLDNSFDDILTRIESSIPLKKVGYDTTKLKDFISKQRNDLREANNLYRQINESADTILKRPGAQTKGSANTKIKKIEGLSVEDAFRKTYSGGDIEKARWIDQNFLAEAATARGSVFQEIWDKASNVRKGFGKQQSFGSAISERIRYLSPSEKEILFGKDGVKKADYMAKWFASQPMEVNASGTGSRAGFFDFGAMLLSNVTSAFNVFRYNMARFQTSMPRGKLLGNPIDNPLTRGAAAAAGSETLIPITGSDASEKNLLLPNR